MDRQLSTELHSNMYTATTAGDYSVKVTQNSCTSASSNTITVAVNTAPASTNNKLEWKPVKHTNWFCRLSMVLK